MSVCPRCGQNVIRARISPGVTRAFDAEPTAEGDHALWFSTAEPGAPAGLWRARHHTDGDRFGHFPLRTLHECTPTGMQLELSTEAAPERPNLTPNKEPAQCQSPSGPRSTAQRSSSSDSS